MDTMGIDQYGQTYHGLGEHPRKELLDRLGRTNARKMFIDTKSGDSKHVGYVVGGLWIRLYKVNEWTK